MQSETKNCQNCKKDFTIEPEDFSFYEKIKVPPPTFCPWCRFIRRMTWRNERALYKRNCDLCKKDIISTHQKNAPFPVYCWSCWHSDKWDATTYGVDYDFSRPFFEQYQELLNKVPHFALWQRNVTNSEYANLVGESKNVYLSVSVVLESENVFYSKAIDTGFNIFDSMNLKNSENCYENVEGERNYNSQYLIMSRNCIDSYYLIDCLNCHNCFMSSNLRNQQYYFRNKKLSREDYEKEVAKIELGKRSVRQDLENEFSELRRNAIYKFSNVILSPNSTGHNLSNVKNGKVCFDCYDGEDFKYCYRAFISKDAMDYSYAMHSELMYEYTTGANYNYNVKFSYAANSQVRNAEYTYSCISSTNLFGCAGVQSKDNVIFNKVYGKEKFEKLRTQIIKQMYDLSYTDRKGRVYQYGEFFPVELSPYTYNESAAQEFETLIKEKAEEKGYKWHEPEERDFKTTIKARDIPDDIKDVGDKILNEVLECVHTGKCNHQCTEAFKITQGELQFYRKHSIPLPDKCPNCRYYERFAKVPLPKLYKRVCMNCDKVEFETPYSPERSEKVFCESCYNKEIY
ncbi:hypothetical protein A3I95_00045 [Candidatus Nomurabacteria bacterium RIFCSPLOWO2_02_FULL_44_12]|uniref:Zinc-binding domain-containing protein n=1 Tax=Candidatus Nomurabacteria bacterium RIFCSPLOWO2_12_FULL_44_11 TaxID=1801796 RepID=A0A1F6Y4W4_9BACT|nr:MAG: hypothetical protein A3E95_01565 [Candidatus Nomurabacteria bacterium RIFCSPHIGHO2_12_FULL_44_22b]OGJ01369.1 MAG: hypothetical protein A3G53_02300 [Candidatus Nomurabacteria bacterium RIFCSPLOWO2_12_FULL_44_11]OGJ08469.1 MAG: hypothetical protein A3I95_00045 [Candidatus Nomurabacteria bacterium RIFCSPLOWO2_02_FULL_44_12]